LGPHPRRHVISLPVKASLAAPTQTAAEGPKTAAGNVRVGEDPKARLTGSTATETHPTAAARIAASRARRIARDAAMEWLAATYPLAFGADVKPVAIGVGRVVWPAAKAAGIKRRAFNDALSRRSGSPAYLETLVADGAVRIDLDGGVVEPVGLEHQVNALDRLAKIERRLADKGAGR
jgi:ProQ/FINO family